MGQSTKVVALDIHRDSITVAVADPDRQEPRLYGTIASTDEAVAHLADRLADPARPLRFCYEAGPCGYGVYRLLTGLGHECTVVAPSLIPRRPGDRIKTDRRDAVALARLHRHGELTAVWVPDPEQEAMRDLERGREDFKHAERRVRQRLTGVNTYQCWCRVARRRWTWPRSRRAWPWPSWPAAHPPGPGPGRAATGRARPRGAPGRRGNPPDGPGRTPGADRRRRVGPGPPGPPEGARPMIRLAYRVLSWLWLIGFCSSSLPAARAGGERDSLAVPWEAAGRGLCGDDPIRHAESLHAAVAPRPRLQPVCWRTDAHAAGNRLDLSVGGRRNSSSGPGPHGGADGGLRYPGAAGGHLVDKVVESGQHITSFNGADLANGIYVVRLSTFDVASARRILLLR